MDTRKTCAAVALMAVAGIACNTNAQLIINEVAENPPGGSDGNYEYIELYGCPNMPLDGYVLALIKGGADNDGDDVLDNVLQAPEIDEAVALDGWSTDANGFFVVAFDRPQLFQTTLLPLTPNPGFDDMMPESPINKRFLNGCVARAAEVDPAGPDGVGNLDNDGSSTYLLIRRRPNDTRTSALGTLPVEFAAGHAWRKDVAVDKDFDSKIDGGNESTAAPQVGAPASTLLPFQLVDEIAWSNDGGKEYVEDAQNELSDTPGFNPDILSRYRYFVANPMIGNRTQDDGVGGFAFEGTRTADESWFYGEAFLGSVASPLGGTYTGMIYDDGFENGTNDNNRPSSKGPTDVNALGYDGSCDPEPDNGPLAMINNGCNATGGPFLIDDISRTDLTMTPGGFNDHPTDGAIQQFRYVSGDLDFDGDLDLDDLAIANGLLGATLDDQEMGLISESGTPDMPGDDITGMVWKWQGVQFQQLLALIKLVDDGPAVTQADIDVIGDIVIVNSCVADFDNDGDVDLGDFGVFGSAFNSMTGDANYNAAADFDNDGDVDLGDFGTFGGEFGRTDCLD